MALLRTLRSTLPRPALAAAALGGALALALGTVTPAAATSAGQGRPGHQAPVPKPPVAQEYVALGDSYTSGPGLEGQTDANCARSNRNYPSLVTAARPGTVLKDASCSGATTAQVWQAQGTNPPQIEALSASTRLVTVQLGGNDIGFSSIIGTCLGVAPSAPDANPCQQYYASTGTDALAARIGATAPKIAAVLSAVRERSPKARIVVVGYPDLLPDDGSACRATIPFATGDFPYLLGTVKRLNTMLAQQARAAGAAYADTYRPTIGHDVCKAPAVRWVEPLVPTSPAAPFHPNALGHRAMASAVLCRVGAGRR